MQWGRGVKGRGERCLRRHENILETKRHEVMTLPLTKRKRMQGSLEGSRPTGEECSDKPRSDQPRTVQCKCLVTGRGKTAVSVSMSRKAAELLDPGGPTES